jgi:uncharacterized protein (TIGR03083 family)
MIAASIDAGLIAPIDHDEAMALAAAEYDRLLDVVDRFTAEDWARPTDCTEWDVRQVLCHLLGWMKANADPAESARQLAAAAREAEERGVLRLHAQTALHVREHADLTPAELTAAVREWAGRALAGRSATPAGARAATMSSGLPGEPEWTVGYLVDVIFTRDLWMHRVDLCRATGQAMVLDDRHDGRIVADVVADWARRHGQPFALRLTGPAGGSFTAGRGGPEFRLDAVEFCRILSGRGAAGGLLTTFVPF